MTQALTHSSSVMDPELMSLGQIYAQALDGLVADSTQAKLIASELHQLEELLKSIPGAMALLTARTITKENHQKLVDRIFHDRTSELISSLLGIMARHGRMSILPAVRQSFDILLARRDKQVKATVITATQLDQAMQEEIRSVLSESLDANVVLETALDPKMLGGMVIQVGDKVFDSAVSTRLEGLLKNMLKRRLEQ
ncbi:MAG TPA: ATP synthase F1 subunit delta [Phycisphaerae bacterium]|nr:ATP synthase F1 subunit delta [Phycisphaerae bacterium]